jgi:hypothetical protein
VLKHDRKSRLRRYVIHAAVCELLISFCLVGSHGEWLVRNRPLNRFQVISVEALPSVQLSSSPLPTTYTHSTIAAWLPQSTTYLIVTCPSRAAHTKLQPPPHSLTVPSFFAHPRTGRYSAAADILAHSIRTSISKSGCLCDLALTYKAASTPVNNMIFTESESNNMGRGAYDTTGTPKPQPPPPK